MKKPLSITIVSECLIAWGIGITVLSIFQMASLGFDVKYPSGEPVWFSFMVSGVLRQVYTISGIAIMLGRNWGRLLFIIYGTFNLLSNLILGFIRIGTDALLDRIPAFLVFVIFIYLLNTKKAKTYFKSGRVQA